jgi:ribosomal protein S6--L-glutamate ligase
MNGRVAVICGNERTYALIRLMDELRKAGQDFFVLKHSDISLYLDSKHARIFRQSSQISTASVKGVIARVGSGESGYALTFLKQFVAEGIPVINPPQAIVNCDNKFETLQLLYKAGIEIPRTFFAYRKNTESFEAASKIFTKKEPVLIKLLKGSGGAGISKVGHKAVADVVETIWETGEDVHLQEFIKFAAAKGQRGRDVRVIVMGGKVISGYQRVGRKGSFKANIHTGGEPHKYDLTEEQKKIALKCTEAVKADYAGVDILSSADKKQNIVIEVNSSPGFEGFESGTGVNVARRLVEFCLSKFDSDSKK